MQISSQTYIPRTRSQPKVFTEPQAQEASSSSPDKVEITNKTEVPALGALKEQAVKLAADAASSALPGPQATTLRVLSFNTYFESTNGLEKAIELIKESKADLVGLQEVNTTTKTMAEALGMHYVQQDKRTALLSRFPIKEVSPKKFGVKLDMGEGKEVGFFNIHATSFPFQPAQIARKPSGGGPYIDNEKDAIWWANWTRGDEFRDLISEADKFNLPTVVTGDFNEPSHLDWTPAATDAELYPFKVDWPGSRAFEAAGFKDSYREMNPNEVDKPGRTWPANKEDIKPEDPNVRIDYVMHRGEELKLVSSEIVGESAESSDIVVEDYPSDHRAILATYELSTKQT